MVSSLGWPCRNNGVFVFMVLTTRVYLPRGGSDPVHRKSNLLLLPSLDVEHVESICGRLEQNRGMSASSSCSSSSPTCYGRILPIPIEPIVSPGRWIRLAFQHVCGLHWNGPAQDAGDGDDDAVRMVKAIHHIKEIGGSSLILIRWLFLWNWENVQELVYEQKTNFIWFSAYRNCNRLWMRKHSTVGNWCLLTETVKENFLQDSTYATKQV